MDIREQLKRDEGLRLHAYTDTEGHLTIGYGCNLDEGITTDEADMLLTGRLRRATQAVDAGWPWARHLSPARFGALVNMCYQMGPGGLRGFAKMLAAVEHGDYETAATEMLDSRWARQTPERAHRLADQMRQGAWT